MRPAHLAFLCVLMAVSSATVRATNVTIEPIGVNEGNATALLERSSQYYIDAMRALILERFKDEYWAIRWETLESTMRNQTLARLEYHFERNGLPAIRVYHAMGGPPLSSMAKSAFNGPTPAGTPTSPGSTGEPETWTTSADSIDYVAADASDTAFFTGFDEVDVRGRILPTQGSVLEAFHVEGSNAALDPEFKALAAIENDLREGVVPRGGMIRGAIGGATCGSCRHAMRLFSEAYDVDVRVSQMFSSLPRIRQRALLASGEARLRGLLLVDARTGAPLLARDVLARARDAQIRQSLSPRAMGRSFKGMARRNNSFRLGPMRLQRVSEGASGNESPPNPDVGERQPGC